METFVYFQKYVWSPHRPHLCNFRNVKVSVHFLFFSLPSFQVFALSPSFCIAIYVAFTMVQKSDDSSRKILERKVVCVYIFRMTTSCHYLLVDKA